MRLARNDGVVHNRRSYCSLSRTFCSALSDGAAANAGPAAINATVKQLQNSLGMVPSRVWWTEYAAATIWRKCGGSPNHGQPAADAQHLTGNVIRAAAQKEHHRLGDFLGLGDPAKRDRPGQRLAHPLRLLLEQGRVGRAGADAVDVDVIARHLAGQRFGEGDQAALRRSVYG